MKRILDSLNDHFIFFLISAYLAGAFFPAFGVSLKNISLGSFQWLDGSSIKLSLLVILLSVLLFNAGLGAKISELKNANEKSILLISGLISKAIIPVIYIFVFSLLSSLWANAPQIQDILAGLALIASMPVAGSSAAWVQKVDGDMCLTLALIISSTFLSPFLTPFILNISALFLQKEYSQSIHMLASHGTNAFLLFSIVLPSIAGLGANLLLGKERINSMKPHIKMISLIVLLVLSYINASSALPQLLKQNNSSFFLLSIGATLFLCLLSFISGYLIPKALKSNQAEESAMMYSLGMTNNGAGLVLSSIAFPTHPLVMVPIMLYVFCQQVLAALINNFKRNKASAPQNKIDDDNLNNTQIRRRSALKPIRMKAKTQKSK